MLRAKCVPGPLIAILVALFVACGHQTPTAPTAASVAAATPPAPLPPVMPVAGGSYEANFTADATCTNLPEAIRSRTYSASVGSPFIFLSGAVFGSFPPPYPMMNILPFRQAGDSVIVYASDPPILEHPTPDSFLMIEGTGEGARRGETFDLFFRGAFMYCAASRQVQGSFLGCSSEHITCRSERHRLTLVRR